MVFREQVCQDLYDTLVYKVKETGEIDHDMILDLVYNMNYGVYPREYINLGKKALEIYEDLLKVKKYTIDELKITLREVLDDYCKENDIVYVAGIAKGEQYKVDKDLLLRMQEDMIDNINDGYAWCIDFNGLKGKDFI